MYRLTTLLFIWSILCGSTLHAASSTTPSAQIGYKLYPGDLLRIEVFDNPDLTTQVRIPASGVLAFPLLGDLGVITGQSVEDLRNRIALRLDKDFLVNPVVTCTVLEFGPRTVFVLGGVERPSNVSLNPLQDVTAIQAISQAGGFKDDADRVGSMVVRADPSNPDRKRTLPIPASDRPEVLAQDVILEPGDVIIVPRLDRVYVIGYVTKPGALNLPTKEQLTVSKAISLAGGFERFARKGAVQLVRSGAVKTIDIEAVLTGASLEDPVLQPGDTVYVPESRF